MSGTLVYSLLLALLVGVVGIIILLLISIRLARHAYRDLHGLYHFEHDLLTPIRTIKGMMQALEAGLENGSLQPYQRSAIYKAIDEQIVLFEQATRTASLPEPPMPHIVRRID